MASFGYVFPAIRGIQAGREYYVSMCPLRIIPRIFLFDEDELKPELRAQRVLNRSRIPEIAGYIRSNPKNYVFSALTASVDGNVKFESLGPGDVERNVGQLNIPMQAKFVINDGQHRRAGIEAALRENPDLGDETIAVVFFRDVGLRRCQQLFADLNRHAIRTTTSLGILYDHRDELAQITKALLQKVQVFTDLTETQRSTISNRSIKLFTLSGIHHATQTLVAGLEYGPAEKIELAAAFWNEVSARIPDWKLARERKVSAAELRRDFVHAHTLALAALARVGNSLLLQPHSDWRRKLTGLTRIDWSRSNTRLWEGRAMNAGRLSKRSINIVLTANAIKNQLGLKLSKEEEQLEVEYLEGQNGRRK